MIRKGKVSDSTESKALTEACARHMLAQGIAQWNENYPTMDVLERDLKAGHVRVFIKDNQVVGTVMFSQEKDAVYNPIHWSTPDLGAYYIHRLAVHPNHQSQGIARALMDHIEAEMMDNKATAIRLDTFSQNLRNQRFYQARGYQQLGNIYFPHKSEHPFYCYEKVLHH